MVSDLCIALEFWVERVKGDGHIPNDFAVLYEGWAMRSGSFSPSMTPMRLPYCEGSRICPLLQKRQELSVEIPSGSPTTTTSSPARMDGVAMGVTNSLPTSIYGCDQPRLGLHLPETLSAWPHGSSRMVICRTLLLFLGPILDALTVPRKPDLTGGWLRGSLH